MTKNEAIALGLTTYFTGVPCRYRHVANRTCKKGECVECIAAQKKRWDKTNPDRVAARRKKYREAHKEVIRERTQKYYESNRSEYMLRARNREIAKLRRTPSWADSGAIAFFYECRPAGCHVDHIIPLQGKAVSGLHVETNLQWLPIADNLSKGNKYSL